MATVAITGTTLITMGLKALITAVLKKGAGTLTTAVLSTKYQMRIVVKNATQFRMVLGDVPVYWNSGRYADGQGAISIEPFQQLEFEVCSGDYTGSGVTGGNTFKLMLDHDTTFDFAIGWTCPVIGKYKAQIIESNSAQEAYNKSTSSGNGNLLSIKTYTGKNERGESTSIRFRLESTPGQFPIYKVIQEVQSGNWN